MNRLLAILLFMLLPVSIGAAPADKLGPFDFTVRILDAEDAPINDDFRCRPPEPAKESCQLTLGRAAANALGWPFEDEKNLPGDEKQKRGVLALYVVKNAEAKLSSEDVALIKKLIDKLYTPVIVARVRAVLP